MQLESEFNEQLVPAGNGTAGNDTNDKGNETVIVLMEPEVLQGMRALTKQSKLVAIFMVG